MFDKVVLPAPFSPSRACTSPGPASKLTFSFATTPGKCLVIPTIRTAGDGEAPDGPAPPACVTSRGADSPTELGRRDLRDRADHALDEPLHRVQILDREPLPARDPQLALLVIERALELVELARDDRLLLGGDLLPGRRAHLRPERSEAREPVLDLPVVEAGLPGAVHRGPDAAYVVGPPVVDGGRQPLLWCELLRIRVVTDPRDPVLLGVRARCGRIDVLS